MQFSPIKCWVLGASGYTGAELCQLILNHQRLELTGVFSSGTSSSQSNTPVSLAQIYPAFQSIFNKVDVTLQPWCESMLEQATDIDLVFLALPHEVSAELAPLLIKRGCKVLDLSGAFRLDMNSYPLFYGFEHPAPEWLDKAEYVMPELYQQSLEGQQLISLPGCYPTAATLALQPIVNSQLARPGSSAVVTAVSGVSGAGRKASLNSSFCEVSLKPYAVLTHRHQAEIARNLGIDVSFVPQLGNFKRGIVATCWIELKDGITQRDVDAVFAAAYNEHPFIRLRTAPPAVDDVAHTPWCDIHAVVNGRHLVVISALDNLLKGAASQAIQVANRMCGLSATDGLQAIQKGVVG